MKKQYLGQMKRVVIFGQSKTTEDATRNIVLRKAFCANTKEIIFNTSSIGVLKPDSTPFIKLCLTSVFAPMRWISLSILYLFVSKHDIIYVPYPSSYIDGWLACFLGKIVKKQVIIDGFLGVYDTIVGDRELFLQNTMLAKIIWYYEKWFLSEADIILVDTDLNKEMLKKIYHLPDKKIKTIPVGIDEKLWRPFPNNDSSKFRVAFWCTFIPLHGADVVAKAALLLEKITSDIEFVVIGTGQQAKSFKTILKKRQPGNLTWIEHFISLDEIYSVVKDSHCCLGIFGNRAKTHRVIPYKVYQTLACGQPLITARTNATEKIFTHGKNALLVNPADPDDLVRAILSIYKNRQLAKQLGKNGRRLYETKLSYSVIENEIRQILKEMV